MAGSVKPTTGSVKSFARSGGLAALLVAACASMPRGATPAQLAQAKGEVPEGYAVFQQRCAPCHGERGESVSNAPAILGPGALPEYPRERNLNATAASGDPELLRLEAQTRPAGAPWRDPFRTASDLYRYTSKNMPLPAESAGTLSPDQYWAVVNFMLVAQGVALPAGGVNPANASSVRIQK